MNEQKIMNTDLKYAGFWRRFAGLGISSMKQLGFFEKR
jgi:hypothetical protein